MLIGEGDNYDEIKELVKLEKLEDCVIFVGTTDDVNKYMMAFDVFALPSRFEGLPLVLVEAQCTGLPCVASREVSVEADITGLVDYEDYEETELYANKLNSVHNRNYDREVTVRRQERLFV